MLPRKNFENLLAVMAILVLFKFSGRFYLNFLTLLVSARQICFVRTRAVDLGGPSVYQGGLKFEIKHKSHCFQKSKLVEGGAGGQAPPWRRPWFAHFRLCVLRRKVIAIIKIRNYEKFVYIKNIFENGWWEDAYCILLTLLPASARGHKLQKPLKELAYISVT